MLDIQPQPSKGPDTASTLRRELEPRAANGGLPIRIMGRLVFSQGLFAVGAGGFEGAIRVEDYLPAPAVDADFMMKLAK